MNREGRRETGLREQVRRELSVMFSRRHQPMPLRVAKWAAFLVVARRLHGTRWFGAWAFGLPIVGLGAQPDDLRGIIQRTRDGERIRLTPHPFYYFIWRLAAGSVMPPLDDARARAVLEAFGEA